MANLGQEFAEMLTERYRNRKIDDIPDHINKLSIAFDTFNRKNHFMAGDIVVWKTGLKNKIRPALNEPCIVIEMLEKPLYDITKESGTAFFNEPLDLVLGTIDTEGDFTIYYYDKRRFTHIENSYTEYDIDKDNVNWTEVLK